MNSFAPKFIMHVVTCAIFLVAPLRLAAEENIVPGEYLSSVDSSKLRVIVDSTQTKKSKRQFMQ